MKNKTMSFLITGIALCLILLPVSGFAVPGDGQWGMGHPGKHQFMKKTHKTGYGKKGHILGPQWKETLTDDQKKRIDVLHLEVKKKVSLLKAGLNVKKAELNNTIIKEGVSMAEVTPLIKDIVAVKMQIMEIMYSHKIDMRKVLTEEQRVSFDMGLLEKSGKKSHHR